MRRYDISITSTDSKNVIEFKSISLVSLKKYLDNGFFDKELNNQNEYLKPPMKFTRKKMKRNQVILLTNLYISIARAIWEQNSNVLFKYKVMIGDSLTLENLKAIYEAMSKIKETDRSTYFDQYLTEVEYRIKEARLSLRESGNQSISQRRI